MIKFLINSSWLNGMYFKAYVFLFKEHLTYTVTLSINCCHNRINSHNKVLSNSLFLMRLCRILVYEYLVKWSHKNCIAPVAGNSHDGTPLSKYLVSPHNLRCHLKVILVHSVHFFVLLCALRASCTNCNPTVSLLQTRSRKRICKWYVSDHLTALSHRWLIV